MKVLVFNCRKVLEINCRKLLVFTCFLDHPDNDEFWQLLHEHKRKPSTEWMAVAERMRGRWNCVDFQHFINGFKKENPRYLRDQLEQVEKYLLQKNPERAFVAAVMAECCRNYRYRFSQFRTVYELMEKGLVSDNVYKASDVQKQNLSVYTKAFHDRCAM